MGDGSVSENTWETANPVTGITFAPELSLAIEQEPRAPWATVESSL
jgi:hypothetical protein